MIWEGINPFLPAVLKQFSVIYYLKSLCPVDIPVRAGHATSACLADFQTPTRSRPLSQWVGILIVALIALYVSSVQVRRMEINYTTE